jgi:hypothetical protein
MQVTNSTSLHTGNLSTQRTERKAVMGGGAITSALVAKHAQKNALQAQAPARDSQGRNAVIGGGAVTSLGVAAHVRRMLDASASKDQRKNAVIGGGAVTAHAVAAHVRKTAQPANQHLSETKEI